MLLLFIGIAMSSAPALCQPSSPLPDAPQPAVSAAAPHRRWRPYVDVDHPFRPLTDGQKMRFWLHLEVTPYSPIPSFIAAGFEQGIDGNPRFGSDSGAYGERLGAAFVRDASMRFFVSSLLPVVLHEDPRYYRKASGHIVARGLYAGKQALVTHTDSGRVTVNYSDLLGHLAASALTLAYYPASSANGRVVVETWLTSIAGDAGNNLILEFWPSIASRWRRHRARLRAEKTLHSTRGQPGPSIR